MGRLTVVLPGRVLDGDLDAVVARAAPPKVVVLEVEPGLIEAVQVREVVHGVDDVERVHARSIDVRLGCVGVHGRVLDVDEVEGRGGLRCRELRCADVGDDVVAATKVNMVLEGSRDKYGAAVRTRCRRCW